MSPFMGSRELVLKPLTFAVERKKPIEAGTLSRFLVRYSDGVMTRSHVLPSGFTQRLLVREKIVERMSHIIQATPLSQPVTAAVGEPSQRRQEWKAEVSVLVSQLRAYPTRLPIDEAIWRFLC